jgi:carbonic anhydrase
MTLPQRLHDGYRSFRASRLPAEQRRYRDLAEFGQAPESLVIGCCDSRVAPEVIFDARPGELFVVRNVANLVPPYEPDAAHHGVSAALEYAVSVLHVRHIVVLGHARCGGIEAFARKAAPGDFIGNWISLIAPAAQTVAPHEHTSGDFTWLEHASVIKSIENAMTFPFVRNAVQRGELALHGAYFGVATGELSMFDPSTGRFVAVPAD